MMILGARPQKWRTCASTLCLTPPPLALELRKGSADIASTNSISADLVKSLCRDQKLEVLQQPGTSLVYVAFNLRDPILKDVRVRQALAMRLTASRYSLRFLAATVAWLIASCRHNIGRITETYSTTTFGGESECLAGSSRVSARPGRRSFSPYDEDLNRETSRLIAAVLQQQLRKSESR